MVDYLNAFDESYIPLDMQKIIKEYSETMIIALEESYHQLVFRRAFEPFVKSILKEDYLLIREAALNIKDAIQYLYPLILNKIADEISLLIQKWIDIGQTKEKYPLLPQEKIKVYQNGIVIITEMIALQRYFTSKYPSFDMPFKKEEAKSIIDSVYWKYFEVIKANSTGNESNEKQLLKDHDKLQENGEEIQDVQVENNGQIQPCCNACNIF